MDRLPLNIGIDARELLGKPTGVGRFLAEILRVWSANPSLSHRFTLFIPGSSSASMEGLDDRFKRVMDSRARPGTWWEQTRLPRLAARERVDVLLSPGYTAPLRLRCPSVVVVHDLSFFAHPEWFQWREGVRRRWLTKSSAQRAHTVITVSKFSASEIQRWLGVTSDRIRVAYHGHPAVRHGQEQLRDPVVLFVGSLFNRRHIPELIRAFARVSARVAGASLVLVGDNRTSPPQDPLAIAEEAGIRDRVQWHAYAPDADVERLYESARVFVFLSEYEGFAMTPLEALAHGAPLVLLDTPVAREVYRSAARYVTTDVDAIARALGHLLVDDAERRRLLSEGRLLMQEYTWDRTAAQVLAALEGAAASR